MKSALETTFKIIVIICGLLWLGTLGVQAARYLMNRPVKGSEESLHIQSYTNTDAGFFSFTNLSNTPQYWCGRGVVSNKVGTRVFSTPVCTGVIEPKSTAFVEARYKVGAVKDLCKGDNALGLVDWDKCTFVFIEED